MTKTSINTLYTSAIFIALALSLSIFLTLPAKANVYTYKDKNGRTVFSDVPIDERTKIHKITGQKSTEESATTPNITSPTKETLSSNTSNESLTYKNLSITQPLAGSTINNFAGHFLVKVNVEPSLAKSHNVQLIIDGITQGASHSRSFKINNAPDGDHQVQAQILSKEGNVIISSAIHSFKVLNSPK